MKSPKKVYVCTECDQQSPKWLGRCPSCGAWNTMVEETYTPEPAVTAPRTAPIGINSESAVLIDDIKIDESNRTPTGISEFDRVLGGGLVCGSVVLLGGEPGIGKSTLLMQISGMLAKSMKILYVSGEESQSQLKLRAERIAKSDGMKREFYILCETNIESILKQVEKLSPSIIIIDSIQTMYSPASVSSPGSVSQVRDCANQIIARAKTTGMSVLIVGHVNKEGGIAGPKVLEHMVDAVLSFDGERSGSYRVIRAVKNRFGSTNEIGVFEMDETGLTEIPNPSAALLAERPTGVSGSCAVCVLEGTRPIIAEVQALVTPTTFSTPRRTASGVDYNRMYLLLAVLERRLGLKFSSCDVYLNVIGGLRLDDTGADAGIALALVSALRDKPVPHDVIAIGEIGLSGELRAVSDCKARISEAARLGFTSIAIPKRSAPQAKLPEGVSIAHLGSIYDALKLLS